MPLGDGLSYEQRFWNNVDKTGAAGVFTWNGSPCWLWLASQDGNGYGLCWNGKRVLRAHIYSDELAGNKSIKGLHRDHLCRVPRCVNPLHLESVTCKVNVLRGVGSPAQNARKSVCKRGHPLDGGTKDGRRYCITCNRESGYADYAANMETRKRKSLDYYRANREAINQKRRYSYAANKRKDG